VAEATELEPPLGRETPTPTETPGRERVMPIPPSVVLVEARAVDAELDALLETDPPPLFPLPLNEVLPEALDGADVETPPLLPPDREAEAVCCEADEGPVPLAVEVEPERDGPLVLVTVDLAARRERKEGKERTPRFRRRPKRPEG
jgi:hypothetical protein